MNMRGKGKRSIFEDKERGLWTATIEQTPDPATGRRGRWTTRPNYWTICWQSAHASCSTSTAPEIARHARPCGLTGIAALRLKPRTLSGDRSVMAQYTVPRVGCYQFDQP